QAAEIEAALSGGPERIEMIFEDVPDQRARPVVDLVAEARQHLVQRNGFARLKPVERFWRTRRAWWRLAINLSAGPLRLVDQDRPDATLNERFDSAQARGPGAKDDDRIRHVARRRSRP